jgi:hypothetical protein
MSKQQHTNPPKPARPVHEIRIGLVKAVIWANRSTDGIRHNVTFVRSYREGDEWHTTTSFGRDDLLKLSKVANEAHTWITQQPATKPTADLTKGTLPGTGRPTP